MHHAFDHAHPCPMDDTVAPEHIRHGCDLKLIHKMEVRLHALESHFKKHNQRRMYHKSLGEDTMTTQHQTHQGFNDFLKGQVSFHQKSLSTSSDGKEGSIIIPAPVQEHVSLAVKDFSPLRKLSRISAIATDSLELLVDKGNGDVGWVLETGDRDETQAPELTKVKINTHEMYAKPKASQRVLDDAHMDLEAWIIQKISWQMGMMENKAFINGDGNGKPKGILTYGIADIGKGEWGKIEAVKTGKKGDIVNADCLFEVFHALKPEYLEGASWMMPRSALSKIRQLKDTQGQYLFQQALIQGQPSTLLGHPVYINDAIPALDDDSLSILFGNFSQGYHIVDRQDMHIVRDPYSQKPYVEFYATKRVGGDVINFDALKIIQCAE